MKIWVITEPIDYQRAGTYIAYDEEDIEDIKRNIRLENIDGDEYVRVEEIEIMAESKTEKDIERKQFIRELVDGKVDSLGDAVYYAGQRNLLDD